MNDMTGAFATDASAVAGVAANLRLLQDVDVRLTVEIGSTTLSLRELLALGEASVIELDRQAGELLDVLVNGTLIGRGEVVTVGDRFGVKMTELVAPEKRG
jgi:flagellar motor switch protein FliN/FliY